MAASHSGNRTGTAGSLSVLPYQSVRVIEMNPIRRRSHNPAAWAVILLLVLAACDGVPSVPYTVAGGTPAPLSTETSVTCRACAQATRAIALTQAGNNTENQAAATAEIVRANAQATLNSADATLSAAQTQDQNSANIFAAQIASTAEIERARAQATLVAAGFTQSAALTQDAIRQTQGADQATTGALAVINQQNQDALAAGTQTAVANGVATQARSAVATSQWYADQVRQRSEQRQVPIGFLWTWGLPIFIVVLAGLVLWGVWRWLKVRQANQRILNGLLEQLPAPAPKAADGQHDEASPYIEGEAVDARYQVTEPEDQVHRWLDEVKRKLRSSDRKDEDDDADN